MDVGGGCYCFYVALGEIGMFHKDYAEALEYAVKNGSGGHHVAHLFALYYTGLMSSAAAFSASKHEFTARERSVHTAWNDFCETAKVSPLT